MDIFDEGLKYYNNGQYDAIIQRLSQEIKLDPKNDLLYVFQGITFKSQKKYDLALQSYSKAIELNPKYADAYCNRGIIYQALNQYDFALEDYDKAIELGSQHAMAYYNRGITYHAQKKYAQAIINYSEAIRLKPRYAMAYYNRGNSYQAENKFDLSIQDYSKAIQLNPIHTDAHNSRGYYIQKKFDLSIQDYSKAIELIPTHANADYKKSGIKECYEDKYVLSFQDYQKAFEQQEASGFVSEVGQVIFFFSLFGYSYTKQALNSRQAMVYYNRGITNQAQNKYDVAIENYSKAIELDSRRAMFYYNRGISYNAQNKYDLAIKDYNKSIELEKNFSNAYNNRGIAYYYQDKYDLAFKDYQKAIELNPNYADAYNSRGVTYYIQNKFDLSIQDYSKAIELIPTHASAYYNRGITYHAQNKYDLAIKDYNKSIELKQDHPLYFARIGTLLFSQQQIQKAQTYLHLAQNILNNFDEMTLMAKFSISTSNMLFVKEKVKLLREINQKLQNQAQELKQQETITPQQQQQIEQYNNYQEQINELKYQFARQQEDIQKQKNISQYLADEITKVAESSKDVKQRQDNIEKSDQYLIDKKLQECKQPQNEHKQIYYRSFCTRLLTHLQAYLFIQNDLFNANKDAPREHSYTERILNWMKNISSSLAKLPDVSTTVKVTLGTIDYGINFYKDQKLQDKIKKITAVIYSKSGLYELEREILIASFNIIEEIKEEDLKFKNFQFQKMVSYVIQNEKNELASNTYWQLGIDHSLRVLRFLEENSESILTEKKNTELRDIILMSINKKDLKKVSSKEKKSRCKIF